MKLAHLHICGFRGCRSPVKVDFSDGLTVIDGRNGAGKSTLCDAVEFALTGALGKYKEAKADRESVVDYVWWRGDEPSPDNFVELSLRDTDGALHKIRRTPDSEEAEGLSEIKSLLIDPALAPAQPLRQLSRTLIIRDELIATLSLDLTDSDRFQLLREALGSIEAEEEIQNAESIHKLSKGRLAEAADIVANAHDRLINATSRVDQARRSLADDASLASAATALKTLLSIEAPMEGLAASARPVIGALRTRIVNFERLRFYRESSETDTLRMHEITEERQRLNKRRAEQESLVATLRSRITSLSEAVAANKAQEIAGLLGEIADLGEQLGLSDERCPLCGAGHTTQSYVQGIANARDRAQKLNAEFAIAASKRRKEEIKLRGAEQHLGEIKRSHELLKSEAETLSNRLKDREALAADLRVSPTATISELDGETEAERRRVLQAESYLSILDTLSLNMQLESGVADKQRIEREIQIAEEKLARARIVASRAKSLFDATRRASSETLDRRIEQIGPLLGEFYRCLRPHPVWRDIDYKVRGDVRRFLKLEVGDSLNPQFLFSSGQRRATGIAFLLSIFLSTSWRKLNTIILDDPVQHLDDYRAVHLAEVLAQLSAKGLQVVCAVEDPALADLFCRRVASAAAAPGRRITLGMNNEGDLGVLRDDQVKPFSVSVLSSLSDTSLNA